MTDCRWIPSASFGLIAALCLLPACCLASGPLASGPGQGLPTAQEALERLPRGEDPRMNTGGESRLMRQYWIGWESRAAADHARAWAELVVQCLKLRNGPMAPVSAQILPTLPPPTSWRLLPDALKRAFGEQTSGAEGALARDVMVVLAEYLSADGNLDLSRSSGWARLQRNPRLRRQPEWRQQVQALEAVLLQECRTAGGLKRLVELQVAGPTDAAPQTMLAKVPDLVGLLGEGTATPLLTRILTSAPRPFLFEGLATRRLARRLARQHVVQLRSPQWSLIEDSADLPLLDSFLRRFKPPEVPASNPFVLMWMAQGNNAGFEPARWMLNQSPEFQAHHARLVRLADRLSAGDLATLTRLSRTEQTVFRWAGLDQSEFLRRIGGAAERRVAFETLAKLLSRNPHLTAWTLLARLARNSDQTAAALALLQKFDGNRSLSGEVRLEMSMARLDLLLAGGQTPEGTRLLRRLLANDEDSSPLQTRTIRLGAVLQDDQLLSLGLESLGPGVEMWNPSGNMDLYRLLFRRNRARDVERLITATLGNRAPWDEGGNLADLSTLLATYVRQERFRDAALLLTAGPSWGAGDVSQLVDRMGVVPGPFLLSVAATAGKTGDVPTALTLLRECLRRFPSLEDGYSWLWQFAGDQREGELRALAERHPRAAEPARWLSLAVAQRSGKSGPELDRSERLRPARVDLSGEAAVHDLSLRRQISEALGRREQADHEQHLERLWKSLHEAEQELAVGLDAAAARRLLPLTASPPKDSAWLLRCGAVLRSVGKSEPADRLTDAGLLRLPEELGVTGQIAIEIRQTLRWPETRAAARRLWRTLRDRHPNEAKYHFLLGLVETDETRVKSLQQALRLSPDYRAAHEELLESIQRDEVAADSAEPSLREAASFHDYRWSYPGFNTRVRPTLMWDLAAKSLQDPWPVKLYPLPASRQASVGVSYGGDPRQYSVTRPGQGLEGNLALSHLLSILDQVRNQGMVR